MVYNCIDHCSSPDVSDVLLVTKSGKELTMDEVMENSYSFRDYDYKTQTYSPVTILDLHKWDDIIDYSGNEFTIIKDVQDKIRYAFACMYNDQLVENTVKELFPHIENIKITANRKIRNYFLQDWMNLYGFTLKDFIMNDSYIVLSCTTSDAKEFEQLVNNGLIGWDNIEHCSYYDEEDDNETNGEEDSDNVE